MFSQHVKAHFCLTDLKMKRRERTDFAFFVLYSKHADTESEKFLFLLMQNQHFIKYLLDFYVKVIYNILSLFPRGGTVYKNARIRKRLKGRKK